MTDASLVPQPSRLRRGIRLFGGRNLPWTLLGLVVLVGLYYGLGAYFYHRVDADPNFMPAAPIEGGSHAVDMAAALIEREVVTHAWQPNDPWFMPNGMLDNTRNFQSGIQGALARFSLELVDQVGRTRGSSRADPDLERAAGLLQFPGDVWFFDLRKSFLPSIPSEQQYRAARQALLAYNQRLANNGAVFDRRTDSLSATINRVVIDLGNQSAIVDDHLRATGRWPFNMQADDLFYAAKGRLYALLPAPARTRPRLRGDPAAKQPDRRLGAGHGLPARGRVPAAAGGAGRRPECRDLRQPSGDTRLFLEAGAGAAEGSAAGAGQLSRLPLLEPRIR